MFNSGVFNGFLYNGGKGAGETTYAPDFPMGGNIILPETKIDTVTRKLQSSVTLDKLKHDIESKDFTIGTKSDKARM